MCGLFGFINLKSSGLTPAEIEAGHTALQTITHRGPDQHDAFIEGNLYMGHRRLSILDLSEAGRQPMCANDAVLTVNGEVYNFQALREEIGKQHFKSSSDSEVLLHGFRHFGFESLLEKIDGMYAFVLYDQKKKRLHFVRDRTGIKPLLYARLGDYFIWASELKAIKQFADGMGLSLKVDNSALFDFLTYRYIPGEKTLYKNVYNLLQAHSLSLDMGSGEDKITRYWSLPVSDEPVDYVQAGERVRSVIKASVEEQMVADVPVGFFLSGGMDSSILVAMGAEIRDNLSTFSIGYDHKAHDETQYADIVAKQFGTAHHKKILSAADSEDIMDMIVDWYDQPFGDNSALPTYHVSRFTRETATVALSGDGGDELFGGYRWYDRFARFSGLQLPLPATNFAPCTKGIVHKLASRLDLMTQGDPLALYCLLIDGLPPSHTKTQRSELEIPEDYDALWFYRQHDRPDLPSRKRLQVIDFHTFLPDDILTKVDRVSMAVSLESRVPFLAREVVEMAFSLPEDFLYKNGELKGGLKYAFRNDLPSEILERDKKGFSIPMHIWRKDGYQKFQMQVYNALYKQGDADVAA